MTNATKTLSVVLVALLAITALVKLTSAPQTSKAFRTELVNVDTTRVNQIEINAPQPDNDIRLYKENNSWHVTRPDSSIIYRADEDMIYRVLNKLVNLDVNALVTRNKKDYTRYKVDSTGTKITLRDNKNKLESLYIGGPQAISRREFNTYVRPADREEVYTVSGYLTPRFNKTLEDWRNKRVWSLERDSIKRVDFIYPADSSFSMERAGKSIWTSRGDTLATSETSSLIGFISSLNAGGFVNDLSPEQFGEEKFAIQMVLKEGGRKTLRFREAEEDSRNYHVVADGYPYVFTLNKQSWDNTVLRPREELLMEQ